MKKIIMVLSCFALILSSGMITFAAETVTTEIDVYARYIGATEGEYTAPVRNGAADIIMEDGTVINVTDAPDGAVILVIVPIPSSEKEAWSWFADCLENTGAPVRAYDIYFLDANGNRFNADGAVITITCPSADGKLIACSVNTSGIGRVLSSTMKSGKITFTANGSHYYVLAEKLNGNTPDVPDETTSTSPADGSNGTGTTDGTSAQSAQTGDSSNIWLWIVLAFTSGGTTTTLIVYNRKKNYSVHSGSSSA